MRTLTVGRGSAPDGVVIDRHVPVPLRVVHRVWRRTGLPRAEHLLGRLDVVHATDLVPPPTRRPVVLGIHDVLPLTHPEHFAPRNADQLRWQVDAARVADVVLTDCEATAEEIRRVTGLPDDRVAVATLGHRPVPAGFADLPPLPGAEPPYLLYVGAVTARKGLARMAAVLADLPPGSPPLLVAGPDGWRSEEIHATIRSLGLGPDRVRFLGRISDDDLDRLYAHATLLCHPSEAEGFGIPVLEAMAFGVPVVAGDIPSVREIGGDAVVLVPPLDVDALRDAVGGLLADPAEQVRLANAGRARASQYTWSGCADAVAALYRTLAP